MELKIRWAGIAEESVVDGPGLRAVVFFQGCPHRCPGCHNPETWDFAGGTESPVREIWERVAAHPLIHGITLSGGEPFAQPEAALYLAERAKERGWNVMVYTGYTWEELTSMPDPAVTALLRQTDLLVEGRFVLAERDLSLPFRGSRNQRIIRVSPSLAGPEIVLWEGAGG